MPYIAITTSKALSSAQKDALKDALGQAITLIPGKIQSALMVSICDGQSLYYAGQAQPDCAFIDIRLKGEAEFEHKKLLAEKASQLAQSICGILGQVFITFSSFAQWGNDGTLMP